MDHIPVKFDCNGKKYAGYFCPVSGAGATSTFHLSINNYYWGRLRQGNEKWVFDCTPKNPEFAELADFFGEYLTAWYE